jgi:arsenate reductase
MAEGFIRSLHSETIDALSAGIDPKQLDPRAVTVMKEDGIDISGQYSKHVQDFLNKNFDFVITVCDGANEMCPIFPGKATVLHQGFEDPPRLAENSATEEEALQHYRRIRDEIRRFVENLPVILKK